MSQFMSEAGRRIDEVARKISEYGHLYAFSRASGLTPWEASGAAIEAEKDLPHGVLQYVRVQIDAMVEEWQRA